MYLGKKCQILKRISNKKYRHIAIMYKIEQLHDKISYATLEDNRCRESVCAYKDDFCFI